MAADNNSAQLHLWHRYLRLSLTTLLIGDTYSVKHRNWCWNYWRFSSSFLNFWCVLVKLLLIITQVSYYKNPCIILSRLFIVIDYIVWLISTVTKGRILILYPHSLWHFNDCGWVWILSIIINWSNFILL